MIRIKICGITSREDAVRAAGLGAWAIGVILAPESPRRVDLEQAAGITEAVPPGVGRFGVFVNADVEEIAEAVSRCGLTGVQMHGEESPEQCLQVRRRAGVAVIKAIRVAGGDLMASVVRFDTDLVLLDTYHPERRGGTGVPFDWNLAAALPEDIRRRLVLSGGLTPENVAEAVTRVSPFAVDVSSGIEERPGVKDPERMKKLFETLRQSQGNR
ncbi:MAG: phosphoribosylanthranilate isomerase [Thermoleophilia bacterium]|nr:phosphoribosylanthranilate isomerase [Thermoleophilia bacterium]